MKIFKFVIIISLLLLNITAKATVVNLATGKQNQTVDAQNFIFDFNSTEVPVSDGNDGLLSFQVRGDYSLDMTNENISISVDNLPLGPYSASNSNLIQSFNKEDNEWVMSTAIPGFLISSWTADQHVQMIVSLSQDVNIGLAAQKPVGSYVFDPYVDVTLQYTVVPVPLSLWFFATGIFSLLGMRRFNYKNN